MLPTHETVDAIFSVVKALHARQHTSEKSQMPRSRFSHRGLLLLVWGPAALFLVALFLFIINRWAKAPGLHYAGLFVLLLMYLSYIAGYLLTTWTSAREVFSLDMPIKQARKLAHTDAPHVQALLTYPRQDLQYVLTELKAERAAWERFVGVLIGALDKIGLIPGLIAVLVAFSRFQDSLPSWLEGVVYGASSLYIFGFASHLLFAQLDRGIMLLEWVIETQQSAGGDSREESDPMC